MLTVPDPLPRVTRLEGVVKLRLTSWPPLEPVVQLTTTGAVQLATTGASGAVGH